ncbi:transcription initiation factor IID, 18kD subunit-domain-containing protein [Cladochytrium replicatum]|nr:transcription initiation factor IID, 18kD subunit-domain-containing protein [Cladochytrium replicatum]
MKRKNRLFTKEVKVLMYGFGDVADPAYDSAELMEELLMDYLNDLCAKAARHAPNSRVKASDFLYALRNDPKRLARAHELLSMDRELKAARKMFDVDEMSAAGAGGNPGGGTDAAPAGFSTAYTSSLAPGGPSTATYSNVMSSQAMQPPRLMPNPYLQPSTSFTPIARTIPPAHVLGAAAVAGTVPNPGGPPVIFLPGGGGSR